MGWKNTESQATAKPLPALDYSAGRANNQNTFDEI
jgi:hypothetical protein